MYQLFQSYSWSSVWGRRARPDAALAISTTVVVLLASAAGDASPLAPHRAHYALSQGPSQFESNITGLKGRLEIRFEASCDGWHVEEFLATRLYAPNVDAAPRLSHLEAWETAGGRGYWFTSQSYEGATLAEETGGAVRRDRDSASVELRLSRPSQVTRALPAGTLFPAGHIEALIGAGAAGQRHHRATVFDGTVEDAFEISTFIGEARAHPLHSRAKPPGH